ncbi:PfkB family carbohydrate kinase [Metabacillus arenae]|uniref:Fructoselysine 6-kinase n=1 Tax=Metabacillus arenae TaxID=2771434 RepID=A0A926NE69_9BACI|nr:PfkB family carbohydrate kinase [Metabacillus arenae]MBD1382612.1 fructoselysine 6-kinase [Metabacillus arenae]
MKLIAIGDNVVDIYKDRNEMFPGGNALNVAVLARQYGAAETAFIGIVGDDVEGGHIVESLKSNHVDISKIRKAYGESGKAYVDLNDEGDRIFVCSNKGGIQSKIKLRLSQEDYEYIKDYDVLHTSIYSNLDEELPQLQKLLPISYDFSNHFTEETLKKVCPYITFAFVSGSDFSDQEIEDLILFIHKLGTLNVIVTRGSKGIIMSNQHNRFLQGIEKANVIDTLGAGDSFIAGFLTSYLDGFSVKHSLKVGAVKAALTCEVNGAFGHGKQLIT